MQVHPLRIAADVGGTFTDIAIFDDFTGQIKLGKCLTTPEHLIEGIRKGVHESNSHFSDANLFLHGTTIAINTLLERTGAKTALVTTKGFRDIYEIGRINRPEAYNLFFKKHQPLIERALRFEINERLYSSGEILRPLLDEDLEQIATQIQENNVEAVAIMLLHSYRNPNHEIALKSFLSKRFPNLYVSASHELSQEYREYERTSTVAANAYVGPRITSYLDEVVDTLKKDQFEGGFLIVQSTGGLYDAPTAQLQSIRMLESGPAAGVIGSRELCRSLSIPSAIAFDMGGTTAKSGVVLNYEVLMTSNSMIGGYNEGLPVQIPMIDIQEVGTGGGSIAWIAQGNSLRVGPKSAGSKPGPVCYNLPGSSNPTVTDANLLLGRLSAKNFLGGGMELNVQAAQNAMMQKIGVPLGLSFEESSEGIIQIAAATMSNVVKRVTTEKGQDTRDFPMIAFGGAGPLHAVLVAKELQIPTVIIPNSPGHFSAYGMLVADLRRDFVRTLFTPLENFNFEEMNSLYQEIEAQGIDQIKSSTFQAKNIHCQRGLDMRYVGQEHAVTVDIPNSAFENKDIELIKALFDRVHTERYGYCSDDEKAEIVSIRTSVQGDMPKPKLTPIAEGDLKPSTPPQIRPVYFQELGGWVDTEVFNRNLLMANNQITGPALIEEHASTTVIFHGDILRVDSFGNLHITVNQDA